MKPLKQLGECHREVAFMNGDQATRFPPLLNFTQKAEGFPGQRIVVLPRDVVAKALKNPLTSRLIPSDIGFFPCAKGHFFERKRGVDQAIFICCSKGSGWCEIRSRRHEIYEGDLLVIPPGEPHAYGANEQKPWTISWFHVLGEEVRLLLPELGMLADNPVLHLGDDPQILALFEDVLEVMEHGYAPFQLLHASRIMAHLISLMVWRSRQNWRTQPDARQKITYCIDYMKQHIDKPLRLSTLAALANLSSSYFNVLFRQETGYSCMDYLMQLRVHQACQWLDTTDWPIKMIAARLGFEDPLYFSRLFRSIHNGSPKEYRRTHKG
jgi:AraC-like DNA-binding protein